jgi:hypothetical protein
MRKFVFSVAAVISAAAWAADSSDASDTEFVVLSPLKTLSWSAIPSGKVMLPVPYPPGAEKKASLTVEGFRYSRTIGDITDDTVELDIPAPVAGRPETENLYTLTLAFADGSGRIARVAAIDGYSGGSEGSTRCISPESSSAWKSVRRLAVMPLPENAEAIRVNESVYDAGENASLRWFMLDSIKPGNIFDLEAAGYSAALEGCALGTILFLR